MRDERRPRTGGEPTTYNILFVCSGNTCRSPMAEGIAAHALEERGWGHVAVASAGIAALRGGAAAAHAIAAAGEAGIDIADHVSMPLTHDLLDWADLVLAMSPSQRAAVLDSGYGDKVALVTDFMEGELAGQAIVDPFGGDLDEYRATFAQLRAAIDSVLGKLEPILSP